MLRISDGYPTGVPCSDPTTFFILSTTSNIGRHWALFVLAPDKFIIGVVAKPQIGYSRYAEINKNQSKIVFVT